MMRKDIDLFCISAEINGVAMMIAGSGNQSDNNETDILDPEAMRSALYGVQTHLERIAGDLEELEGGKGGRQIYTSYLLARAHGIHQVRQAADREGIPQARRQAVHMGTARTSH